jgi:integrase/recombinase XerD
LGPKGKVSDSGLSQIVARRSRMAGLGRVHCHQFRHGYADDWLRRGGTEGGLMQNLGWKSRQMVDRYGSSVAASRARDEYRRLRSG